MGNLLFKSGAVREKFLPVILSVAVKEVFLASGSDCPILSAPGVTATSKYNPVMLLAGSDEYAQVALWVVSSSWIFGPILTLCLPVKVTPGGSTAVKCAFLTSFDVLNACAKIQYLVVSPTRGGKIPRPT